MGREMDMRMRLFKLQRRDLRPATVRRHRGQAIVEMALVMMLLLSLTFGILDMGVYMYRYIQAANCVREVARRAVVRQPTTNTYCIDVGLTPTLSADPAGLDAGDEITATIDTDHNWMVISYLIPGLGPSAPVDARVTMRMEGQVTS